MKAVKATDGERVQQHRIYVAPPGYHLTLADGRVWFDMGPTVNRHRPAIDPLFESAAKAYGRRVIGVVLTGFLDDGVAGLAAIKRRGGIAVVQDPADSYARNMPLNALRNVQVDYCLPIAEIGPRLVALVEGKNTQQEKQEYGYGTKSSK
jgi:two-component system chemotaxis response regulator CheB